MKTKPTTPPSSSPNALALPTSWSALSTAQLHRWAALATAYTSTRARTLFLLSLLGGKVRFSRSGNLYVYRHNTLYRLPLASLAAAVEALDILSDPPSEPLALRDLSGSPLRYEELLEAPFSLYLQAENLYQGYLLTQQPEALSSLAALLFDRSESTPLDAANQYLLLLYYMGQRARLTALFPHLFTATATTAELSFQDVMAATNAQIRALTAGDITKEPQILNTRTERALVELNEKAREAQQNLPPHV